ncbi:MAG: helix-turn-helix domain-containing protein [Actinomycetales bacterium]|uniref:Helix-turn-helix domain-containing protein n=1 Tax=Candidatus Phosphoribacter hodrii TaxID=2953743 RepID=A0A9D7XYG0_9MICO|nr:helix-turn-helix domain-containing protein [Candidatus Phosphoribacter hodrii]
MLSVLGLDEAELAAYRMLVTGPSGTAMEVSGALGVSVGKATRVIASLEAKGLVARSGTAIDHVVASPPDIALGALIVEHQEGIRQAELEMRALRERYLAASSSRAEQVVDVVRGREAVRQRFNQLQRGARREVLEFVKGDVVAVSVDENVEEEQAISRGVVYRFLLERQTLERPGLMAALSESIRDGVELRVTRELPIRLIVVDREIAMIPLAGATDDQSGGALLLRAGGLLDLAVSLFEVKWRDATRLDAVVDGAVEGSELSARERQILLMLNAGLTDRTVATRLGLSARTVQRYVADMMERAEIDTRLQLGVQATRRGWI